MPNKIDIICPNNELIRGETVMAEIVLQLDKALKVRGVHGDFLAAEETKADYTSTTTNAKGQTQTSTHTAVEHSPITAQTNVLVGSDRLGFVGNMTDAVATLFGGGKNETISAGEQRFQIEISIPEDAPATHRGSKTRVFYELNAQVDVPAARDLKAKHEFSVAKRPFDKSGSTSVHSKHPDESGKRGVMQSLFGPDVQLELALAENRFVKGDKIEGFIKLQAAKPLKCRKIQVRLAGVESSTAHGYTDHYTHLGEPHVLSTPGEINDVVSHEFAFEALTDGPVSSSGAKYSIDWYVQVDFDVPWAKDPFIRAPIVLGESG